MDPNRQTGGDCSLTSPFDEVRSVLPPQTVDYFPLRTMGHFQTALQCRASSLLPLRLCLAYFLGTFVLFLLGPLGPEVPNLYTLSGFLALYFVSFYVGYTLALRLRQVSTPFATEAPMRLVRIMVALSSLFYIAAALRRVIFYSGGVSFSEALLNPGTSYLRRRELGAELFESGNFAISIENALFFLSYFGPPLLVRYWPQLPKTLRVFGVLALVAHFLSFIVTGTNAGIGDMVIMIFAGYLLSTYDAQLAPQGEAPRARRRLRGLLVVSCGVAALVLYLSFIFVSRQDARGGHGERDMDNLVVDGQDARGLTTDFLITVLGPRLGYGANMLINHYVTHGYMGLALCMELPFEWTYGVGNSRAAMSLLDQYGGVSGIWERTYVYRSESTYGWLALGSWSTMYAWFASDLTFYGVALVMGVMGFLMADLWCEALFRKSILAAALFAQLLAQAFYLVANNHLFHMRGSFFGFSALIVIYLIRRLSSHGRVLRAAELHQLKSSAWVCNP
jgi:hypothetical protein